MNEPNLPPGARAALDELRYHRHLYYHILVKQEAILEELNKLKQEVALLHSALDQLASRHVDHKNAVATLPEVTASVSQLTARIQELLK